MRYMRRSGEQLDCVTSLISLSTHHRCVSQLHTTFVAIATGTTAPSNRSHAVFGHDEEMLRIAVLVRPTLNLFSKPFSLLPHCHVHTRPVLGSASDALWTRCAPIGTQHRYTSSYTGLFGNPLLSEPEGFAVAASKTKEESEAVIAEILNSKQPDKIVHLFDELSDTLCRTADLAECIRLLHPDQDYAAQATNCCSLLGSYVEELNTHSGLHEALKQVTKDETFRRSQDEVMKYNVASLMHDFETSGIHLSGGERQRVVELNAQILALSHVFVYNCAQPVVLKKTDCPSFVVDAFPTDGKDVVITHVPYTSPNPLLRSAGYLLYHKAVPQQMELLDSLLSLRHELASLVGYDTYAHRALKTTTAQTPECVADFLHALSEEIMPLAKEEAKEMLALKQEAGEQVDQHILRPWDVTFVTRLAQRKLFPQLQSNNLEEYFSLSSCIEGLNTLFQSLFGVRLASTLAYPGEIWHDSVQKYAVISTTGELLGLLYCDFFHRPEKAASDCQFTIQGGRSKRDGSYQTPVVTLSLSLPSSSPVLLTQQAVENLFHEMGHAIHSVLGRSKYQNVSGTRCATDFAEVPSNLMEMFLRDSRVLSSFAHNSSGQVLPPKLKTVFQCSANMFPAFNAQMQLLFAIMDQQFHSKHPLNKPVTDLFADLHDKFSPIPYLPGTAWFLRFNHLHSYAAKYYAYPWASAMASLIWKQCFSADPFSSEMGGRLHKMLSYGGGLPPKTLLSDMLGFSPTVSDLVEAYVRDIVSHKEKLWQVQRT